MEKVGLHADLEFGDTALKAGVERQATPPAMTADAGMLIGISIQDSTIRHLIEGLSIQLELVPENLRAPDEPAAWDCEALTRFELIIADLPVAIEIQSLLRSMEERTEGIHANLIAVRYPALDAPLESHEWEREFGGVLTLPQDVSLVLVQLRAILHAHRAFARRYQTVLEELHLNRSIFRSMTNGISVVTVAQPDMPLIYVNPAFETMTGYSFEETRDNLCLFLQAGDPDQPGLAILREAIQAQRHTIAVLKNFRKDGSFFWNEISLSPIHNLAGDLTHFVGIQSDITERVEFEAALRKSEKLAAVGRLAASIAHEINNPLEAVTNLIYLAQQATEVSEMKDYLIQADRELVRAALITSQSLKFSRQSTYPQAINITEMLDSVLDLYQGKLENAGILVERRERITGFVVCLESEIRQVLSNLIRNAHDAINGCGGRLLIRTRNSTEWRYGSKGVVITIADTGAGISPETMKHLYTAFFTTKSVGGTGLGLWISSEIVERHCGRMRVRSSQRAGNSWTVFEIFLPFKELACKVRH